MHVVVVYKEDYPWDVRIEKIAKSLESGGYDVTIVCRNYGGQPRTELINGIEVRRLPVWRKMPQLFRKVCGIPLWFNPFWLWEIFRAAKKNGSGAIIVRDLPLMLSGILCARMVGAKSVFDMAECYPEMYRSAAASATFLDRVVKHPWPASIYERLAVRLADHIFVMIQESANRLVAMDIPNDKLSIVSNTPPVNKFEGRVVEQRGRQVRLVYVGFVTEIRGLDLLVQAVHILKAGTNIDVEVDIIGEGSAKADLESLVEKLKLKSEVRVHGWLSHEQANQIMMSANVGALTYRVCSHWNHTIPNKIFDYMLAGMPVLATEVVPIKRIIESEKCGVVAKDLDINDIANKISQLADPLLRQEMGANGNSSVLELFNWDVDSKILVGQLNSLTKPWSVGIPPS